MISVLSNSPWPTPISPVTKWHNLWSRWQGGEKRMQFAWSGYTRLELPSCSSKQLSFCNVQAWNAILEMQENLLLELKQSTFTHSTLALTEMSETQLCPLDGCELRNPKASRLRKAVWWQVRQSHWLKRQFHFLSVSLLINLTWLNLTILCLTEVQTSELSSRDVSFLALHKLVPDMKAWI